jgi:uncharacterized protein YkwD
VADAPLSEPVARVGNEVFNVVEGIGAADDCYQRDLLGQDFIEAANAARAQAQICQGVRFSPVSALTPSFCLQNAAVNHSITQDRIV